LQGIQLSYLVRDIDKIAALRSPLGSTERAICHADEGSISVFIRFFYFQNKVRTYTNTQLSKNFKPETLN